MHKVRGHLRRVLLRCVQAVEAGGQPGHVSLYVGANETHAARAFRILIARRHGARSPSPGEGCGICRVGKQEQYWHCNNCAICLPLTVRDTHLCRAQKYKTNCPVGLTRARRRRARDAARASLIRARASPRLRSASSTSSARATPRARCGAGTSSTGRATSSSASRTFVARCAKSQSPTCRPSGSRWRTRWRRSPCLPRPRVACASCVMTAPNTPRSAAAARALSLALLRGVFSMTRRCAAQADFHYLGVRCQTAGCRSFNTVVTENVAAAAQEDADADAEEVSPETAMDVVVLESADASMSAPDGAEDAQDAPPLPAPHAQAVSTAADALAPPDAPPAAPMRLGAAAGTRAAARAAAAAGAAGTDAAVAVPSPPAPPAAPPAAPPSARPARSSRG